MIEPKNQVSGAPISLKIKSRAGKKIIKNESQNDFFSLKNNRKK